MLKKGIAVLGGFLLLASPSLVLAEKPSEENVEAVVNHDEDKFIEISVGQKENQLENLKGSIYPIIIYRSICDVSAGTGTLFDNGYTLISKHMVKQSLLEQKSGRPEPKPYLKEGDEEYKLELVIASKKHDAALMWVKNYENTDFKEKGYSGKIGDSDELGLGETVGLFGNIAGQGVHYRECEVISLSGLNNDKRYFRAKCVGAPGDSGGPTFKIKDGKLELVDIVKRGMEPLGAMEVLKINTFKEEFKDYLEKYY